MAFCVDIGGSFIKFGVARAAGDARLLERIATPTRSWDDFAGALAALCTRHGTDTDAQAPLAICTAGLIDPDSGVVPAATNIPCLVGHRVADELSGILRRPVSIANDADCFALAEATRGAGRGRRIVFGIILGTGIGGGLVVDGRLIRGAGGITGEWGHGPIARELVGTPPVALPRLACGCGQTGCIETVGSARGLERLHRHLSNREADSREIVAAWHDGDAAAARTIDIYLELVSEPLALLVNTLGPHVVPVGGGLGSDAGLVAALDAAVRRRILRRIETPLLVPAMLGADAGLIGASALAFADRQG